MAPKRHRKRTFIRQWRKFRELTLEQLALRLDLTPSHLSMLERGERAYTQQTLEAIAEALGSDPASLLMRDPSDPDAPWSIWETLKPEQRRQAIRVLRALAEGEAA